MITKTCRVSGKQFAITDKDLAFYKKISPTFAGETFSIPPPTISPAERIRALTLHRNEKNLFHNISCFSKKSLISIYPPNYFGKVCSREEWFSDQWDGTEYGIDFDFSKTFFENFSILEKDIPKAATVTIDNENSEFTTGTGYCKNCYLINSSEHAEDCLYSKLIQKGKDIVDSSYIYDSELLYECFNVENCYESYFLQNCKNCSSSWFLKNCVGCTDCFGCVNLRNKKYHFLNKKYTQEEYNKKLKDLNLHTHSGLKALRENFVKFSKQFPYKYAEIINCQDCTGDFLQNSKSCKSCYDLDGSEDCKNLYVGEGNKDVQDGANQYIKSELCYQTLGTINTYNCNFSLYIFNSSDLWYSQFCFGCKHCFGCAGLRNKAYHIFNKPFKKDDYEVQVAKIIKHLIQHQAWGQFFPASLSPFGYNITLAQEYFPLTKKEALERGYTWKDEEEATPSNEGANSSPGEGRLGGVEIPNNMTNVTDSILEQTLTCQETGKPYKIQKAELTFYKKMNLPLPHLCPDQRHKRRMELRNPRKLWDRKCDQCQTDIKTTFAPERAEKIFCETCYLKEVN